MSYQVLARKWRPKRFREMAGQEHVLQAVINGLDHDRLHHAYLFTGTRGVGKTTIARIFAKCLNCESGVSSEPCGTCSSCVEINENRFIDLIEVDAASRTKVEDTRELLENVQYAPTKGRYKVYLIDEVHMLSNNSFNALLKTLEEPPPHVKFLLATTDPQKLPATVLSRCLQFNLKNLSPERIVQHLKDVLEQELVQFEEPALWLLGRAANGSMRDALSLTDQAIAFGSGKVLEGDVSAMLGTIDGRHIVTILKALIANDAAALLAAVEHMAEHSPDYAGALESLLLMLHRITIAQMVPDALDNAQGDREQVMSLAQAVSSADVQLFYQLGLHARRDLPLAPDARSGFEMALLRMMAFKPQGVEVATSKNIQQVVGDGGNPEVKKPSPALQAAPTVPVEPSVSNAALSSHDVPAYSAASILESIKNEDAATRQVPEAAEQILEPVSEPEPAVVHEGLSLTATETVLNQMPAEDTYAAEPVATALHDELPALQTLAEPASARAAEMFATTDAEPEVGGDKEDHSVAAHSGVVNAEVSVSRIAVSEITPQSWPACYTKLDLSGVAKSVISHCALERIESGDFYFVLEQRNAGLFNDSYTTKLQESLARLTGVAVQLSIDIGETTRQTPAQYLQAQAEARQAAAEARIMADPNIQMLLQRFDASIVPDSIEPIENEEKA
jgi:DNA polymerase-3 subunit gamma/tau